MPASAIERAWARRLRARDRTLWLLIGSGWLHLGMAIGARRLELPEPAVSRGRRMQVHLVTAPIRPVERAASRRITTTKREVPPRVERPVTVPEAPAGVEEVPSRRVAEAPPPEVDPVVRFQDAMGWSRPSVAPARRPEERDGAERPGRVSIVPIDPDYAATVEAILAERWRRAELPIRLRAMGVQGRVVLVYHIERSGSVRGLRVERSSGVAALDRLALGVVPRRYPRPPRRRAPVLHRVELVYDNPLLERR